jgi:8-oxo-dGTP diphosphatase
MEESIDELDRHPHPHLAVDIALLTLHAGALHALLLRRTEPPFAGTDALPGGFVHIGDSLTATANRVLQQKCGLRSVFVEQLYTFGEIGRDPRGRVVTVAHYALVPDQVLLPAIAGRPLALRKLAVDWPDTEGGPAQALDEHGRPVRLAFDHALILGTTVQRLRGKIDYAPVGFELLPKHFTLLDLLEVHQAVLGRELNKDSFRRRLLASGLLVPTGKLRAGVAHRPAALYRFRNPTPHGGHR